MKSFLIAVVAALVLWCGSAQAASPCTFNSTWTSLGTAYGEGEPTWNFYANTGLSATMTSSTTWDLVATGYPTQTGTKDGIFHKSATMGTTGSPFYEPTWTPALWYEVAGGGQAGGSHPVTIEYGSKEYVLVRGTDGKAYVNVNGGGWSSIASDIVSSELSATVYDSSLYVFANLAQVGVANTTDTGVGVNVYNGTSWSGWSLLASSSFSIQAPIAPQGPATTFFDSLFWFVNPIANAPAGGGQQSFSTWTGASGSGLASYWSPNCYTNSSCPSAWSNVGSNAYSSVQAAITQQYGLMEVFVRDPSGYIYWMTVDSSKNPSSWYQVPGNAIANFAGAPAAVSWYNPNANSSSRHGISLFVVSTGRVVYENDCLAP